VKHLLDLYIDNLEKSRLREGLKTVLFISSAGNAFLTAQEPWRRLANNLEAAATHVAAAVGLVRLLAALLSPFLPVVAGQLLHFLGLGSNDGLLSDELLGSVSRPHELIAPGHALGPRSRPLFSEISEAHVERLRAQFQCPGAKLGGS
jgi:methionyl-tRNA synthetase